MYADPKQVRDNRVPVYINDYTHERLMRLVELRGGQKGAIAHDAILVGIDLLLHELECSTSVPGMTAPNAAHTHA